MSTAAVVVFSKALVKHERKKNFTIVPKSCPQLIVRESPSKMPRQPLSEQLLPWCHRSIGRSQKLPYQCQILVVAAVPAAAVVITLPLDCVLSLLLPLHSVYSVLLLLLLLLLPLLVLQLLLVLLQVLPRPLLLLLLLCDTV
jgi:hypothetical protein